MTYAKQNWVDGPGGATPISAARLNFMEQGISDAHNVPCARVYRDAAISVTSGTTFGLSFNQERFDTDNIHDSAVNPGRLTCKTPGVYQISGTVEWAANATGLRDLYIRLNQSFFIAQTRLHNPNGTDLSYMTISTLWRMILNDYVELSVFQNAGTGVNIVSTNARSPEFMMVRVGT
jgi:hypothetical protein